MVDGLNLQPDDLCLYECPSSFYLTAKKKWTYGKLYVSVEGLYFECSEADKTVAGFSSFSIDYHEISLVQKETSSYIFPCLTVIAGDEKYWFGSLPSRESVYCMIEHFWKERLFSRRNINSINNHFDNESIKSELGQELLNLAYDSERTLNVSARTLHRQGKQLEGALFTMENLHGDLQVADQQLSHLESWLGKFRMSVPKKTNEPQVLSNDWKEYNVVFQRYNPGSVMKTNQQPGTLRISKDGITVLNCKGTTVHAFRKCDVSEITIVTPWEMKIEQRRIGERDTCFNITTAQLVIALSAFQRHYANVIKFGDPASSLAPRKKRPKTSVPLCKQLVIDSPIHTEGSMTQTQESSFAKIVTEAEAQELTQMIDAMKAMAVEISREQHEQLQNIDKLMSSVDKADINIKEDVKRMRRLM